MCGGALDAGYDWNWYGQINGTLSMEESMLDLGSALEEGRTYYMKDMLADSTFAVTAEDLAAFTFDLMPFQSRVFVFSDSAFYPMVTSVQAPLATGDGAYRLYQSYPNPVSAGSVQWSDSMGFTVLR